MLNFVLDKLCQAESGRANAGYDEPQALSAGTGSGNRWQPVHGGAAWSLFPAVPAAHPTDEHLFEWDGKCSMAYGP